MLVDDSVKKSVGRPPNIENQRAYILESAAQLFAYKGFDGASISDLASEVGLSKAAIYHYFPNKRELCDAIILESMELLVPAVKENVQKLADPRDQLRMFMTCHAKKFDSNRYGFMTILTGFEGMSDGAMKDRAFQLRSEHEGLLRKIIKTGMQQGVFAKVDVSLAGRLVLSLLGWMARWYRPDGKFSAEQIAEQYYELVFNGLRVASTEAIKSAKPTKATKAKKVTKK